MIVTHLRLRGSGVPACVEQRTVLEHLDGSPISSEEFPVPTDPAGAGTWITGQLFMIYRDAPGAKVRMRTEVAGVERSVELFVDYQGVDAGVDAGTDGATDAAADAAPDA
jgi:hypothetical protein